MEKKSQNNKKIIVIGSAIIDVLAVPVYLSKIQIGSQPMKEISISYGGNALNEAIILKRLGANVELISKIGTDQAGNNILEFLINEGLSCEKIKKDPSTSTSINIVLVDNNGERYFLTNPNGSMRKLEKQDILTFLDSDGDIVCFPEMFVSPKINIHSMSSIFETIKKSSNSILAVDMTKAKNGETIYDLKQCLKYIDYIFPNESEIFTLTRENDPYKNAKKLVELGAKCAVIKRGKNGCLIYTDGLYIDIPAYSVSEVVDSTGAGDSFVAGFLYGLSHGFKLKECGIFANAVASCVIESLGATQGFASKKKALKRYEKMIQGDENY